MLKDLHLLNSSDLRSVSSELKNIPDSEWISYIEHFGGSNSQVDQAYQKWKKYVIAEKNGGSRPTGGSVNMDQLTAQGWKESIAASALKGPQAEGNWVLDLESTEQRRQDLEEAIEIQKQIYAPNEIEFNQEKAESIAKIRTQYHDALNDMRQYAEAQGVNIDQYDAAILAIEKLNEEAED